MNQIIPEREKPGPIEHHAIRYLRIAKAIGAQIDDRADVLPHVQISADEKPRISSNGVAKIGLCPGAEYGPAKRWLPERFVETAQSVSENQSVHWILFGTAKDAAVSETIAKALGEKCTNRIGKTSIEELDRGIARMPLAPD